MTVVQHVNSKVVLCMFMCMCVHVLINDHRQPSFVMSVCPFAWNTSAPAGQIFVEFDILVFFFKNLL